MSEFHMWHPSITFWIEPEAAREAVLNGRGLLVELGGDRLQYRRVTVMDRPKPEKPARAA